MKHRRIESLMTTRVATVRQDTAFKEIVRILAERKVSGVPVLDAESRVVGVVSEADLLAKEGERQPTLVRQLWSRRTLAKARAMTAGDLMTAPAVTIGPTDTVVHAAQVLDRHGIKRLPVVDAHGDLVGIVSRRDLLSVFLRPDADIRDEIQREVFERALSTPVVMGTVSVDVREGVVTLSGEVERRTMVLISESMTNRVDGVVRVDNRLTFQLDDTKIKPAEPPYYGVLHEARQRYDNLRNRR